MPKVSIITPSFNKSEYVADAINSVLNQTFTDFEYWVIENSTDTITRNLVRELSVKDKRIIYKEENFTDEERLKIYPTAVILNKYYDKIKGNYLIYLSDDDILYPECLEKLVRYFEEHPESNVVWFSLKVTVPDSNNNFIYHADTKSNKMRGFGTNEGVDCQIDGGQIMHKVSCLKKIKKPYYIEEYGEASSHCDGLFMEKLAKIWTFYPYNSEDFLVEHRRTKKSLFTQPV